MATLFKAPTINFHSTTLNGAINDSVDTITLTSTTNMQAPGVIIIDREDGSGTATPSSREVITFTGISSNDLTGCTRGAMNSTARSHSDGALIESVFGVDMWNDLRDAVNNITNAAGTDLLISGTATIAALDLDTFLTHPRLAITSVASIARAEIADGVFTDFSNQTFANTSLASIANVHYGASKGTLTSDSDAATVTFDMNASNVHTVTLGGNRTLAVSNVAVGQAFTIRLVQDATGSRTVTWFSTIKWPDGTAPTLTTTANKVDTFGFICTSSGNYDGYIVGQALS
jgi:hypothetical protein